jgi:hypothetical protein
MRLTLLSFTLLACAGSTGTSAETGTEPEKTACQLDPETYPAGAVEPMALGEVLSPYRWPEAIHRGTGVRVPLDLGLVPCASDPGIDWSWAAALLFVSLPAW